MARLGFLKSTTSRGPTGATQRWPPYLRRARTLRGWQPGPPRLPARDRGHEHNALLFPEPSVQVDPQFVNSENPISAAVAAKECCSTCTVSPFNPAFAQTRAK